MSNSLNYGSKFWLIVTCDGEMVHLCADRLEVLPSGALVAWGGFRENPKDATDDPIAVYGSAAGKWHTFAAISLIRGPKVAGDTHK
jgi:hypothetical protein